MSSAADSTQSQASAAQGAMRALREMEKEFSTAVGNRQTLDSQLKENDTVLAELTIARESAEPNAAVFKSVGGVLIKQSAVEAVENVEKRIAFIKAELTKSDDLIKSLQERMATKQREIAPLIKAVRSGSAST